MAAARATQFVALRNVARGGQQVRQLHMTGPANYASLQLTTERPMLNLPRNLAGLREECKKRNIDAAGSKHDLIKRISANEVINSRAFSTAVEQSRRSTKTEASKPAAKQVREFNTSRSLKAVADSSPIDFAYFPDFERAAVAANETFQVPMLSSYNAAETGVPRPRFEDVEAPVMKPIISATSADTIFLPMSDVCDGHAMNIDFHAMADRVANNLRKMKVPVEEQAGYVKQMWSDLVDDMLSGRRLSV